MILNMWAEQYIWCGWDQLGWTVSYLFQYLFQFTVVMIMFEIVLCKVFAIYLLKPYAVSSFQCVSIQDEH